jgi:transcriptional regulator with XRE-family HTH domain
MLMEICADPISKRELLAYQADVKGTIFRQIRQIFHRMKQHGVTQKTLARRIGMDEGQLSRRLRGDYDLRLETLSDLARGLECRIDVKLTPLSDVGLTVEALDTRSESGVVPIKTVPNALKGQNFYDQSKSIYVASDLYNIFGMGPRQSTVGVTSILHDQMKEAPRLGIFGGPPSTPTGIQQVLQGASIQ